MKTEAIPGEFQDASMVASIDKKKIRNVVRQICTERRQISFQKDVKIWKQFDEKLMELVDVGANLWEHFKDRILKACDELCGKKRGRRSK